MPSMEAVPQIPGCNDTESLSGIETASSTLHARPQSHVATILNPYQGLKQISINGKSKIAMLQRY